MDFENDSVLITGAGMGIGRVAAHSFAQRGAMVTIGDIDFERAKAVAGEIKRNGGKATAVKADVGKYDDAQKMMDEAVAAFGKIDILVNNAGTSQYMLFKDAKPQDWELPLKVCLYGVLNCCHAILAHMIERKAGRIINVVSDAGLAGEARLAVYSGAKAGIIGFSKALAQELGRYNIHVNCVSFGPTESESVLQLLSTMPEFKEQVAKRTPFRRIATMQDQANAIMLLASKYGTFITGQTISSSGGLYMY
jgi:NAD(P)-dependent dehydrogenase (short-subunit alcohol dehydrogenase family)